MKNNHMRTILCLFMCCVLLFTCVPRPAHAVGVDWLLGQIATDIGVTGILEGLGLFRDSLNGNEYYNNLVSNVKDFLAESGMVALDAMNIWWHISDVEGRNSFITIPLATILAVRNYIFDNDDVVATTSYNPYVYSGACSSYSEAIAYASHCKAAYDCYDSSGIRCIVISNVSSNVVLDSGTLTINGSNTNHSVYYGEEKWFSRTSAKMYTYYNAVQLTTSPLVTTDKPVNLGVIFPPSTSFDLGYPKWKVWERDETDGTNVPMVQIGLGSTVGETESLTQEEIWAGQTTIPVPDQSVNDVSLSDILQGIIALPGQMVSSITSALTNFFTISGDASGFGIQLKDFFPFCIPFDLFDFLTVLSAEPQAPVFKWEIPVPQLGQTFELEVDLSAWDPVAAVFRTFELLAFIVGLALITREKFLRS